MLQQMMIETDDRTILEPLLKSALDNEKKDDYLQSLLAEASDLEKVLKRIYPIDIL